MAPKSKKKEEKQTTYVFIVDPVYGWRPAVLESQSGTTAVVSVPEYKNEQSMTCDGGRAAKKGEQRNINLKDYPHQVLPLQNVDHNGNLSVFPDMVRLPYLHEAAILYNLKKRHLDGKPYTRTGDIIIAVNPFQWFLDLYTEKKRIYYSNRLVWEAAENDPRDGMEPHVYEVSSLSYKGLAFEKLDQSILVSGESGAGKTETVKICMNHMASVQQGPKTGLAGDGEELDPVVARVVESNPLLEAFGNAKTRRNDNSSRFGKYLQLQFDQAPGPPSRSHATTKLAGSKCDVYLLEKNRVTYHDEMERTYHIFYQLLAAPDSEKGKFWSKLSGKKNKDFKFVGHTDTTVIEKMSDADHYAHTVKTLGLVGVSGEKLTTLMKAIAVVMQCGNLTFGAKGGDNDKSDITSKQELKDLAGLMGVGENDLTLAFTERTMKTKAETYKVPLNQTFAKDACEAFAKECYGKVFLWVVEQINAATKAEDNYKDGTQTDFGIVGLLDIFGFESFTVNRFEQLCINYANEKLQQKFTEDVFRAVQAEYEAEGIELAEIQYDDNTDVLDLIEGRIGLLAMLNEECVRPKGNDQDFVQKALAQNKKSPCLIVNKVDRMSFGIHHFAGKVMYDAEGFVSSNQDTLPTDLEEIGAKSSNKIIKEKPIVKAPAAGSRAAPKRQKSNLVAPTVWGKYKTQLTELMGNLRKTNSRYIRCIKPNMVKKPEIMEHIPTVEQLRCAGVVAAVTLARSAFPNRLDNSAVMFRYASMWEKGAYPSAKTAAMDSKAGLRADCTAVLTCALKCKEFEKNGKKMKAFVVGKTKCFFRAGALEYLESNRQTGLDSQATTIQKYARGFLVRKNLAFNAGAKAREEQEAREARERAEAARRAKMEAEIAERKAKREEAMKVYHAQMEDIKKDIAEAEEEKKMRVKEAIEKKLQCEKELEELKEQTGEEARRALMEPKKIAAQQQKKLDEQAKLIEFLKKENKKIRKEFDKVSGKFDAVKENNEKLLEATKESGSTYEDNENNARKAETKHENIKMTLEQAKQANKEYKETCAEKQNTYMKMAESRLEYQKTLANILTMIQDTCKVRQIVEDTVVLALECESESKSIMAALEAETSDF